MEKWFAITVILEHWNCFKETKKIPITHGKEMSGMFFTIKEGKWNLDL